MGTLQELEIVYRSRLRMISISKGKRDRGGAGAFAERELCQHHRTPRPPAAFLGSRAGFALAGDLDARQWGGPRTSRQHPQRPSPGVAGSSGGIR